MPLSGAFESHSLFDRVLRMRHNSVAVYGIAVVLVAIATFVRWAVTGHVVAGPFVTYYPAIIIATLIGGFWCGILTIAISGLIGWYLFLPPDFSWTLTEQAASLLLFVFLASLNVAIVAMLNSAVVRLRAQAQNVRVLIERPEWHPGGGRPGDYQTAQRRH